MTRSENVNLSANQRCPLIRESIIEEEFEYQSTMSPSQTKCRLWVKLEQSRKGPIKKFEFQRVRGSLGKVRPTDLFECLGSNSVHIKR